MGPSKTKLLDRVLDSVLSIRTGWPSFKASWTRCSLLESDHSPRMSYMEIPRQRYYEGLSSGASFVAHMTCQSVSCCSDQPLKAYYNGHVWIRCRWQHEKSSSTRDLNSSLGLISVQSHRIHGLYPEACAAIGGLPRYCADSLAAKTSGASQLREYKCLAIIILDLVSPHHVGQVTRHCCRVRRLCVRPRNFPGAMGERQVIYQRPCTHNIG